jgi:ankyrin repeat protein
MKNSHKSLIVMVAIIILSVNLYAGEIHDAVIAGDLAQVSLLLADHPDWLNQQDDLGMTPLNHACEKGLKDIFYALLNMSADINLGDVDNSAPIHLAAKFGHIEMVEELLNRGVDIDIQDNNGVTPLLFSSYQQPEVTKYLINRGADVNISNNVGFTLLFHSVIGGNNELLQLCLDHKADVEPAIEGNIVPLHSAASYGRAEIAKILIDNGAKVEKETEHGDTPLSWALNTNCIDVANVLLENGAKINQRSESNRTPLHNAAQRGNVSIVELFLENGADINAVDDAGWTPLTMGSMANSDVVKYLIVKGAEVNPVNCKDKVSKCCLPNPTTPLHMAASRGHVDIAKALIDNGAKLNALKENGLTPLHEAVKRDKKEMVDYLISRGAFVDIKEVKFDQTELHSAAIMGNADMIKALVDAGADVNSTDNSNHSALEYALFHGFSKLGYELLSKGANDDRLVEMLSKPDLLEVETGVGEASVWYLGHSGWAIKTKNHFLIFDYMIEPDKENPVDYSLASGYVNCDELHDQNVYVFCSHEHWDHYSDSIFNWKNTISNIKYVLGHRTNLPNAEFTYLAPRIEKDIEDIKVSTIRSTDAGVAYLVEVDDLIIYHGGDHANGNVDLSGEFPVEIDYLAQSSPKIDIAFMGVTGCSLGDPVSVRAGLFYVLDKLKPNVTFPMHAGRNPAAYQEFADSVQVKNLPYKISCAVNHGDRFIYKDGEITKIDIDWTPEAAIEENLSQR